MSDMTQTADVFSYWAKVPGHARLHPDDERTFKRASHHFELGCLPTNCLGPLRTAPVVLLFLSPGFRPEDVAHADTPEGQAYYLRQRAGSANLPSPSEHLGAWQWWTRIIRQFRVDPSIAAGQVAILNIAPYKSERFHDHHLLASLRSSSVAIDYAQSVLFPAAEAGDRVVVCLRAAKFWGLSVCAERPYGRALYTPPCTPGGIMWQAPVRAMAVEAVQRAIESGSRTTAAETARAHTPHPTHNHHTLHLK